MKKILICLFAFGSLLCGSCSVWLEVYPKNEQITANYWKAKEDVEAVLASGYSSLRVPVPVHWLIGENCEVLLSTPTVILKNKNYRTSRLQLLMPYAVGPPYTTY